MRTIERSSVFKKDYKKLIKKHKNLDQILEYVLGLLREDQNLPDKYRDHFLTGNWRGYRECHLKPDLLLIYKKVDADILRIARIGTHSDLF